MNKGKAALTATMTVFILALLYPALLSVQAQTATAFTPADKFPIPQNNGTVGFAVNGSYSSATLTDGMWVFDDLRLNDSSSLGTLKLSALNSNMTIIAYGTYAASNFGRILAITYYAEGAGQQTIDMGLNSTLVDPTQWSVIVDDSVFLAKDQGWTFSSDNAFVVTGQTGIVTIVRFAYDNPQGEGNQTFLEQHSVIIATAIALAIVTSAGVAVYLTKRRK